MEENKEKTLFESIIMEDGDHAGHPSFDGGIHYEMAQIGSYHPKHKNPNPDDKDTISIWIYGEYNRPLPHLHFYRGKDRKRGGVTVLTKPNYFPHDGHNDTMTKKEIQNFMKFLQSKDYELDVPVWKVVLDYWNRQNPKFKIPMYTEIPEYHSDMDKI